jgi:hypothetical protein
LDRQPALDTRGISGSPQTIWHLLFRERTKREDFSSLSEPATIGVSTLPSGEAPSCGPQSHAFRARRVKAHPDGRYILLKKYEGFVTSRSGHSFTARLYEGTNDYPVLEAEFDLEELSESDRELAMEGASLVWTIGYNYDGSTRKRESAMYFRRLPPWAGKELGQAKQKAEDLIRAIHWE